MEPICCLLPYKLSAHCQQQQQHCVRPQLSRFSVSPGLVTVMSTKELFIEVCRSSVWPAVPLLPEKLAITRVADGITFQGCCCCCGCIAGQEAPHAARVNCRLALVPLKCINRIQIKRLLFVIIAAKLILPQCLAVETSKKRERER